MAKLSQAHSIADLRALAIKKIPRVIFDYIEGSAEDELTAQWNIEAYQKYEFVPRILRDVSKIDLSTSVQGIDIDLPIISAPTGMSRMFHHEGERAVAKATGKAGTIYTLSTVSTCSIEEVAAIATGPIFFQLYAWRDEKIVLDFLQRSKKSGYKSLMLAVDLAALGKRERDLRNGHGTPRLKRNTALSALSRPAWLYHFLTKPVWRMANMLEHLPHGAKVIKTVESINEQFDSTVNWEDAKKLLDLWDGSFMLKGIQSVADAIKAVELGATGIIISNHGGRQLDGAPAPLDLLPEVVAAVGDDIEVLIDGGIRRGSDVIKAIALGAKACMIGRPYLYGLAAGGEQGVERAYAILKEEMVRVMQLIGCPSLSELDASYVKKRNFSEK